MKRQLFMTCCAAVFLAMMAWGPSSGTAGDKADKAHPELSEEEMYVACADCHQEATPDVYRQWYDSPHGIAMVKCYQCHGTFETFRLTPTRQDCAVCHVKMVEKCPADRDCWDCHSPHTFKTR